MNTPGVATWKCVHRAEWSKHRRSFKLYVCVSDFHAIDISMMPCEQIWNEIDSKAYKQHKFYNTFQADHFIRSSQLAEKTIIFLTNSELKIKRKL